MTIVRLYDMFTPIVADVHKKVGTPGDYVISYMYGHPIEIIENLRQMSKREEYPIEDIGVVLAPKYPLIALFTDYEEKKGEDWQIESEVDLHFIIANITEKGYTAEERATVNFKAKLYPIYDQFLKSIASSGYFRESVWQDIKHTKTDRFFWGKTGLYANAGNVFEDYLDCIELTNLKLTLHKT